MCITFRERTTEASIAFFLCCPNSFQPLKSALLSWDDLWFICTFKLFPSVKDSPPFLSRLWWVVFVYTLTMGSINRAMLFMWLLMCFMVVIIRSWNYSFSLIFINPALCYGKITITIISSQLPQNLKHELSMVHIVIFVSDNNYCFALWSPLLSDAYYWCFYWYCWTFDKLARVFSCRFCFFSANTYSY